MGMALEADVRTIRTTRGPIRVRDTGGEGQPVLLVHSLLLDGGLYDRLRPLLVARGLRCLVPDLPLGAHAEPMLPGGGQKTVELDDEWTVVTLDDSRAAHWEHSIAVTDDGPWILTAPEDSR